MIRIRFAERDCTDCTHFGTCTSAGTGRNLTLRPRTEHEAICAARATELQAGWKGLYQQRNGVEAAISQGVRAFGLRQCRYRGQSKTRLQHLSPPPRST